MRKIKSEAGQRDRNRIKWMLGIIVGLWIVGGLIPLIVGTNLESGGLFGDRYGAINALFSGLAFAGVIVAILMQRRELELQRNELNATREELT